MGQRSGAGREERLRLAVQGGFDQPLGDELLNGARGGLVADAVTGAQLGRPGQLVARGLAGGGSYSPARIAARSCARSPVRSGQKSPGTSRSMRPSTRSAWAVSTGAGKSKTSTCCPSRSTSIGWRSPPGCSRSTTRTWVRAGGRISSATAVTSSPSSATTRPRSRGCGRPRVRWAAWQWIIGRFDP